MSTNTSQESQDTDAYFKQIGLIIRITNNGFISPALGILGMFTNIINMIVFARIGFKDGITMNLFTLSISDFGNSMVQAVLSFLSNPWIVVMFKAFVSPFAVAFVTSIPLYGFMRCSVVITAFITFERCLCVIAPLKVRSIINRNIVKYFLLITSIVCTVSILPSVYAIRPKWMTVGHSNQSVLTIENPRSDEVLRMYALAAGVAVVGFFLFIVICTLVLVITLQRKAAWRQSVSSAVSMKDKSVSKMVAIISAFFIFCSSPSVAMIVFSSTVSDALTTGTDNNDISMIAFSFVCVSQGANAALNIFFYYRMSSKFRSCFRKMFYIKDQTINVE